MDRMSRIQTALSGIRQRFQVKDNTIAALRAERDEALTVAARFQALAEMTHWAELESGTNIAAGDRVRYMLRTYECTAAHTKSLARTPRNEAYWQEVPA